MKTRLGWLLGFAACALPLAGESSCRSSGSAVEKGTGGGSEAGGAGGHAGDAGADGGGGATDGASDAGWTFAPATSVAELTQNNTAACGSSAAPCLGAWTTTHTVSYGAGSIYAGQQRNVDGFWDHAVPSGPQDAGSASGYVSKVPVSVLLPGHAVPVWVETQNWWTEGGGHIANGEDSTSAAQIKNQIDDHRSRGFAGQVVDWYGPGTTADKALPFIQQDAEASGGAYSFAAMIDKGYLQSCGETVTCLNDGIAYLVSGVGASPAYLKDSGGHPILFFFINSYYPTEYALLQDSGVDPKGASFVMYQPNGFPGNAPPNTIGEYAWVNPADGATTQTSGSAGTYSWASDFGFANDQGFFAGAASHPTSYAVSEAHKGFDDNLANWSLDRVIDQQCGMTWLETFHHTGTFGGSAKYQASLDFLAGGGHLDIVMVDTWDDYEEGTEIETGIDNCLAKLDVSLDGSMLTWSPTWSADPMNAAVTGSEATLYEYAVYAAEAGGTALMDVAHLACSSGSCPHGLDLSALGIAGGNYVFYVQAVGMPSIVSTLTGPTTATYAGP